VKHTLLNKKVALFNPDMDGIDHLNISGYGKTVIGQQLRYSYPAGSYEIPGYGKAMTLSSTMEYMQYPGYPKKFLNKKYLNTKDKKIIDGLKQAKLGKSLPNYTALLAGMVGIRLDNDPELCQELIKLPDDIVLTAYRINTAVVGDKLQSWLVPHSKMAKYLQVLGVYIDQLKNGNRPYVDILEALTHFIDEKIPLWAVAEDVLRINNNSK